MSGSRRPLPDPRHPAGTVGGAARHLVPGVRRGTSRETELPCEGRPRAGRARPRAPEPAPALGSAPHRQRPARHTPHGAGLSRPHRSRSAPRTRHCPRWPPDRPLKASQQDYGLGESWRLRDSWDGPVERRREERTSAGLGRAPGTGLSERPPQL